MGFGLLSAFIVEQCDGRPLGWQNYSVAFRAIPVEYHFIRTQYAFRTVSAGVANADNALPYFNGTSTQDIINGEFMKETKKIVKTFK